MAIEDYIEAQGAASAAKRYREGIEQIRAYASPETIAEMTAAAERLESEVKAWCAEQACPQEAEALAHRRFWELDTGGKLLKQAAKA